jgi:hypothetical protein
MTEMSVEALPEHLRTVAAVADQDVPRVIDYFDVKQTEWVVLPDGVQRVEVKVLTEGERRNYLNLTNREVKMNSRTKDLVMRGSAGDDEKALIVMAVVGWDVVRAGNPLNFTPRALNEALDAWPPAAWRPVLKKIRSMNEWLLGDEENLEAMEDEHKELGERIARIKENAVKD